MLTVQRQLKNFINIFFILMIRVQLQIFLKLLLTLFIKEGKIVYISIASLAW